MSSYSASKASNALAEDKLGASGDVYGRCCIDPAQQSFYSSLLQERAWTSPIWYKPDANEQAGAALTQR